MLELVVPGCGGYFSGVTSLHTDPILNCAFRWKCGVRGNTHTFVMWAVRYGGIMMRLIFFLLFRAGQADYDARLLPTVVQSVSCIMAVLSLLQFPSTHHGMIS